MSRTYAGLAGALAAPLVLWALAAGQVIAEVNHTGVAHRITIHSDVSPKAVYAHAGDTIIWRNAGSMPVTLSLESFSFDREKSVRLEPGASISVFFSQPGTYPYTVLQEGGTPSAPLNGKLVIYG